MYFPNELVGVKLLPLSLPYIHFISAPPAPDVVEVVFLLPVGKILYTVVVSGVAVVPPAVLVVPKVIVLLVFDEIVASCPTPVPAKNLI